MSEQEKCVHLVSVNILLHKLFRVHCYKFYSLLSDVHTYELLMTKVSERRTEKRVRQKKLTLKGEEMSITEKRGNSETFGYRNTRLYFYFNPTIIIRRNIIIIDSQDLLTLCISSATGLKLNRK